MKERKKVKDVLDEALGNYPKEKENEKDNVSFIYGFGYYVC